VDKFGQVEMDKKVVPLAELQSVLDERRKANANVPVYITGTRDATHGSVGSVLDFVKRAGIDRVAIGVKPPDAGNP
ncbi:MAG TPA: biopolymer transporter ExbD, partial [Verrucomicrobiae bacterium]|nr:biopolymer transporter ExbD [Verrucomicrobiae bacterium]